MRKKFEVVYCDYCGCKITRVNEIRTAWYRYIVDFFSPIVIYAIGGDGCRDCYKSYCKWVDSRRVKR